MAVEGKLVPQGAANEPASELFERIHEEKRKLIAKGKAKFPKGGESVICIGSDDFPMRSASMPRAVYRPHVRLRSWEQQ